MQRGNPGSVKSTNHGNYRHSYNCQDALRVYFLCDRWGCKNSAGYLIFNCGLTDKNTKNR